MAPNSVTLLGPPEIYAPPPSAAPTPSTTTKSDPFMDLMVANFNSANLPPMGFTENNSATFLSSGNPCLDFFFHIVPDTPSETLIQRLQLAWGHDPLKTLKLICNLRGVRGTGKSDKEGYYTAAIWLHKHHPKTLACNLGAVAEFGYFKDLPEILFRLLDGADAREASREMWNKRKTIKGKGSKGKYNMYGGGVKKVEGTKKLHSSLTKDEKKIQRAKKVVERFNRDPEFKFLHDCVSSLFAECLRSDMKLLNSGDLPKISLAAKWCPSLDSSFDRFTLLCETIARKVFPREEYVEYEEVEEAHYAYRVRDRLRKEVLVPLRKALELPEVYMGANNFGALPYNRVASVAMKLYKDLFLKHDEQRFREYLGNVKSGKATIAAGALLPHVIIAGLSDGYDNGEVSELQWKRMVEDVAKKGKLNNCLAICDVSGSMHGTPIEVCVALGILVSELSEDPWKGKVITFSAKPKLQEVKGATLMEKAEFIERMEWGANTDLQKVFDLILEVAVKGGLKPEQMVKRLFVFSDMEFDQASYPGTIDTGIYRTYGGYSSDEEMEEEQKEEEVSKTKRSWETDYQVIVRKYKEKGYGDAVPEIVFWNLRDSDSTPVPVDQEGVALVSGFSKNLMKLFLDEGDARAMNPEAIMDTAISGEEYTKLVIID